MEIPGLEQAQSYKGTPAYVNNVAWAPDGSALAATAPLGAVAIWPEAAYERPLLRRGHNDQKEVRGITWHPTDRVFATAAGDGTVRLWDLDAGTSRILCSLGGGVHIAAWSPDGRQLAVDDGGSLGVWDVETGVLLRHRRIHEASISRVCWSSDGQLLVTGSLDTTISIQTSRDLAPLHKLTGHSHWIWDIALSPQGDRIASASRDNTVRIWDLHSGLTSIVLEGHRSTTHCVRFSPNGEILASGSNDGTARLWRCRDWECVATVPRGRFDGMGGLDFHPRLPLLAAKDRSTRRIDCWRVDYDVLLGLTVRPDSRRYVNAKVMLLGDTGVGKSGLGLVLSGRPYEKTDSTHGRNVWTFQAQEVEAPGGSSQTREILLWDLAGQPGYRLVHQLHLNEVAVALLVFDSRSETDPFAGVKHWVRALAQARRLEGDAAVPLQAYLVAARVDRGGVAVTKERIQTLLEDLGLNGFFETSAKEGWQVTDLAQAIRDGIAWDTLPMVSSNALFASIKQFLLEEKQQGRLLSTADDLFHSFRRAQPAAADNGELRASFDACIGRIESRGLISRLHFGDYVLLQPELLDAYASAMVQAAKDEPDGLGFIPEKEALEGHFRLPESERVRDKTQEKLLLIATVEELLRHEIALKEVTDRGVDLVFPSQFTRDRPDAPDIAGKQVTFTFDGPLHHIYATLAVRLSYSLLFKRQAMWENAATYSATVGGSCGIHLRELEEGRGELTLFYDERAGAAVRLQFEAYVAEHLHTRAVPGTVTRLRIRVCPSCGYVLPDDLIRLRLDRGADTIRCPACETSVISLADEEPAGAVPAEAAVPEMNRSADAHRDREVAAIRLKGKIETGDYDVFLCYNSKDKHRVMAIGERLKERGILPWLDEWAIKPGTRWQKELPKQINSIRSAAVFIGPGGPGPWQEYEVEDLILQFPRRKRPIIPVILEGRRGRPRLPSFLHLWQLVDMREPDPDPFEQLVWGITGQKETPS